MLARNRCKISRIAGLMALFLLTCPPTQALEYEFGGAASFVPITAGECVGTVLDITQPAITGIENFSVEVGSSSPWMPFAARLNWYIYEQLAPGVWIAVWKERESPGGLGMGQVWEQSPPVGLPLAQGTRTALVMCWDYVAAPPWWPQPSMRIGQDPSVTPPEYLDGDVNNGGRVGDIQTAMGPALGKLMVFNNANAGFHMKVTFAADMDGDGWDDTVDCDDSDPLLNLDDADGDGYSTCDGDCNDFDPGLNLDDLDGDGYSTCAGDCADNEASLNPFDGDGDGLTSCDGDCDDADPSVGPALLYYADTDADGYGGGSGSLACPHKAPAGWITADGDCNDADAAINPSAEEICNGVDDDCDLLLDDDDPSVSATAWYLDFDGDGSGDPNTANGVKQCAEPPGFVLNDDDCDDSNKFLNWMDTDGDGDASCAGDCDDFDPALNLADADLDGFSTCSLPADCNDGDPAIYPDAPEGCNLIDDDCDGDVDEEPYSSFAASGEDFSFLTLDGNPGRPAQIADPGAIGDPLVLLTDLDGTPLDNNQAGRALSPWLDPPSGSWTLEAHFTVEIPDNGDAAGYDGLAFVLFGASYVSPSLLPTGGNLGFKGSGAGGIGVTFDTAPAPSCSPNCPAPSENWVELIRSATGYVPEASYDLCPDVTDPACIILNPRPPALILSYEIHAVKIAVDYDGLGDVATLSAWILPGGVAGLGLPSADWWDDPSLLWQAILVDEVIPNDAAGFDPSQSFQAGWVAATGSSYPQEHRVDNIHLTCPVPAP